MSGMMRSELRSPSFGISLSSGGILLYLTGLDAALNKEETLSSECGCGGVSGMDEELD